MIFIFFLSYVKLFTLLIIKVFNEKHLIIKLIITFFYIIKKNIIILKNII